MPNFRYHIHVIQVLGDQPLIDSHLALFLEDKAFITHDLPVVNDETTAYSRRCIDACDFIIMVISDSYGKTNASGVSQLHLSYLTVKTKNKPILILIKSPSQVSRSRQLFDFIDSVEQRGPQQLYYFQDLPSFIEILQESFDIMCEGIPQHGWVRADDVPTKPMFHKTLSTSIDGLQAGNIGRSKDVMKKLSTSVPLKSGLASINNNLSINKNTNNNTTADFDINELIDVSTTSKSLQPITATARVRPLSQSAKQGDLVDAHDKLEKVYLSHSTKLTYYAHAYQDGNIKDVAITLSITWMHLLQLFEGLGEGFSSDAMYRALNEEVLQVAADSVAKILPRAHAVTRCVIRQNDFLWVQEQMKFNNWLEVIPSNALNGRELWKLTDKAKKALELVTRR